MFIRSERLFLRPGWPEDWDELYGRLAGEGTAPDMINVPWPHSAEHARSLAGAPQAPRHPHFLITLPGAEGSRLIGCIGLGQVGDATELAYWIARAAWNHGYATEAGRAVLGLARTLGHRRIVAHQIPDSPASGRVLRKLGFCPIGESAGSAGAVVHAVDLGEPCDCDDDQPPAAVRAA